MATRFLVTIVALVTGSLIFGAAAVAQPVTSVRERDGVYMVAARFAVAESATIVRAVLTDYANIPRFMPDIRSSRIVEHAPGYARVEQEAVTKFMLFSKRVHLVLDVEEGAGVIRFRDISNRSFAQYEGAWFITDEGAETRDWLRADRPAGVQGARVRAAQAART
jgi:hypothetical protein